MNETNKLDTTLKNMFNKTKARRKADKKRYEELDENECMLCKAKGEDKRSLFIECFYSIEESVPEAIDLFDVPERENGYYLRICKFCRSQLLKKLQEWRNEAIERRTLTKNSDGCPEEKDSSKDVPIRDFGSTVMISEQEWKKRKLNN